MDHSQGGGRKQSATIQNGIWETSTSGMEKRIAFHFAGIMEKTLLCIQRAVGATCEPGSGGPTVGGGVAYAGAAAVAGVQDRRRFFRGRKGGFGSTAGAGAGVSSGCGSGRPAAGAGVRDGLGGRAASPPGVWARNSRPAAWRGVGGGSPR